MAIAVQDSTTDILQYVSNYVYTLIALDMKMFDWAVNTNVWGWEALERVC